MTDSYQNITNSKSIQLKMIEDSGLKFNLPFIRKILKNEIDYSYRKAKKVEPRTNTENSLVHR